MKKALPHTLIIFSLLIFTLFSTLLIIFAFGNIKNSNPSELITLEREYDLSKIPQFEINEVVTGLIHPWDIGFLPENRILLTQRGVGIGIFENNEFKNIETPQDAYIGGEGGILGLAIDPEFNENRLVYVCMNSDLDGTPDVRVVRWRINESYNGLTNREDIVTGMPSAESGRHSGCQLEFGPDNNLWIGTGDAAFGFTPQDKNSLGGKILRVDRDGNGVEGNLGGDFDPRIYSYGHRNTQGITFFEEALPNGAVGLSAEHGPGIDDEINFLLPGNFGWDPITNRSQPRSYDESVAMTDSTKFPDAIVEMWASGNPTIAVSGMTMINNKKWQAWDGAVAVAALNGNQIRIIKFDVDGKILSEDKIIEQFGRIRTVQMGPDGDLYFLTTNGSNDKVYKLTPINN